MYRYCYATFAQELAKAAKRPRQIMTPMAENFIGFITERSDVYKYTDFEPYVLNSSYAKRWFEGSEQLPDTIQAVADDPKLRTEALAAVKSFIIEHLYPTKLQSVCEALFVPVSGIPTLSAERRLKIKEYLDTSDYENFLTEALLVALTQENVLVSKKESKKISKLSDEIEIIKYILQKFHKPVVIVAPEHSTYGEINYVRALLDAYASDANVPSITEEELGLKVEYRGYKVNFDKERKAYYQAESIREATRDSDIFKTDNLSFDGLEEEIQQGVKETYDAKYQNGYRRMFAVTDKAVEIPLSSLLSTKLKWVNSAIKRGTVHVIMNDEGEGWVREDDGE